MAEFSETQLAQIRELIVESHKPTVAVCGHSVLQDTSCYLPFTHTGLHIDRDGVWRCPWCNKDAFWGHKEDCPAKDIVGV